MLPILFEHDATSWATFGIGVLSDTVSCEIEEKRNGSYELEMDYPITGAFFEEIALRRLIVAKPNYIDNPQPFRIYAISKPLNGIVTINAQHISYDLSGYVDAPFSEVGIQATISRILDSTIVTPSPCPFSFQSDMSSTKPMVVKHPQSVRALMGGVAGSLLDNYGGEWHFDGYNCILNAARGENRGVSIQYGKNLMDLRQEENNESVYTAVYPYYYNSDTDVLVVLPEKTIAASGTYPYTRILPLDLTSDFQEAPTEAQLRASAESYITTNNIGVPKVNLTISFLESDNWQDRIDLCDTVSVSFPALGVSASAKCIRTKWDVLKERYAEAELGSAKNSLAKTIARTSEISQAIEEQTSQFQAVAGSVASKVTGNAGGFIVLHDTDNDGEPDEILIMNTDDISTATKIIRMNNSGIAFSSAGYAGPYTTAWNIDGEFVADFIASGQLKTNNVTIFGDTNFTWDDANITIVDPTDSQKMIRFGKYDGTNYGLGFSRDGGTTWKSGFDFNGIKIMGGVDSNGCAIIDNDSFDIINASGDSLTHIGSGSAVDEDGNSIVAPFYRLGTVLTGAKHGEYSFSAGLMNSPDGPFSVVCGYNNKGLKYGAVAIGRDSTTNGYGIAIGISCTSDGAGKTVTPSGVSTYLGSVAIGQKCYSSLSGVSIGTRCSAEGNGGVAIGSSALAGMRGIAIGNVVDADQTNNGDSIAIGYSSDTTNSGAIALGSDCHAENTSNNNYLSTAIAIGRSNTAEVTYNTIMAVALGYNNTATDSVAIGCENTISGAFSTAIGKSLQVTANFQFVCGYYNNPGVSAIFVIGNGTSDSARSNAAYITNGGNMTIAGSLTQRSDARLKTISGDVPDVSSVRAVRFKWNDNQFGHDGIEHIGYIAQDVEKVAPYLVQEDGGYKTLDYIGLLCAKIETLERTVELLVKRIEQLEGVR